MPGSCRRWRIIAQNSADAGTLQGLGVQVVGDGTEHDPGSAVLHDDDVAACRVGELLIDMVAELLDADRLHDTSTVVRCGGYLRTARTVTRADDSSAPSL
jgi:hypothetical protein